MHSFCTIRWMFNKNGQCDGPVNGLSPTCPPLLLIIESTKRLAVLPRTSKPDAKSGSRHRGRASTDRWSIVFLAPAVHPGRVLDWDCRGVVSRTRRRLSYGQPLRHSGSHVVAERLDPRLHCIPTPKFTDDYRLDNDGLSSLR